MTYKIVDIADEIYRELGESTTLTATSMTYPFPNNFSSISLGSFVIGQNNVPPPIYLMY
jgi:hypothetical protein